MLNMSNDVSFGSLYEMNKQLMNQISPMPEDKARTELTSIGGWFSANSKSKYFLFLNRERADYTFFNFMSCNFSKAMHELKEVIDYRGQLMDIEYIHGEDDYEIWVKIDGECYMYKLFPCDSFVIEI